MLVSLATLKTALGISAATEDDRLTVLLRGADSWVKSYLRLGLERATVTEFYSGQGTRNLVLRQRPVKSVTEVRMDFSGNFGATAGAYDSTSVLVAGSDYALCLDNDSAGWGESGILMRINTVWPEVARVTVPGKLTPDTGPARGNIKVTYVYGYDLTKSEPSYETLPAAIQQAVIMLVAFWRRTGQYGSFVTKEKLGRWEVEFAAPLRGGSMIPDGLEDLLKPFKESTI